MQCDEKCVFLTCMKRNAKRSFLCLGWAEALSTSEQQPQALSPHPNRSLVLQPVSSLLYWVNAKEAHLESQLFVSFSREPGIQPCLKVVAESVLWRVTLFYSNRTQRKLTPIPSYSFVKTSLAQTVEADMFVHFTLVSPSSPPKRLVAHTTGYSWENRNVECVWNAFSRTQTW